MKNIFRKFISSHKRKVNLFMNRFQRYIIRKSFVRLAVIIFGLAMALLFTGLNRSVDQTVSNLPDLVIGTIVFFLVAQGSFRIMKLAK